MKYEIMNCEEAKRVTGWTIDMDQEYKGVIPGYACGYNFEVTKNGVTDFASCTYSHLTPEDLMDLEKDWYSDFLQDCGCTPTGRVIFRGYYQEEYDIDEREEYFVRVLVQTKEMINFKQEE